jgi:hypothetical protein
MGEKMLTDGTGRAQYGMVAQQQLQGQMQMQPQLHYQQIQKQQLAHFWQQQVQEMEQVTGVFFFSLLICLAFNNVL